MTLGYTEWPVVSSLLKHGLEHGDKVATVIPSRSDPRSQATLSEIRSFLSKFVVDVELESVPVDVHDFEKSVITLVGYLRKETARGRRLVVNLSGGMKILVLEVFTALFLSHVENVQAEIITEDKVEVSLPALWRTGSVGMLRDTDLRILELCMRSQNVVSIAKGLKKPVSTTYRWVRRLERAGFVQTIKRDRGRFVHITGLGRIVFEASRAG